MNGYLEVTENKDIRRIGMIISRKILMLIPERMSAKGFSYSNYLGRNLSGFDNYTLDDVMLVANDDEVDRYQVIYEAMLSSNFIIIMTDKDDVDLGMYPVIAFARLLPRISKMDPVIMFVKG